MSATTNQAVQHLILAYLEDHPDALNNFDARLQQRNRLYVN